MNQAVQLLAQARIKTEPHAAINTPDGPIERILVAGKDALGAWEILRDAVPQTGCWPLINGSIEERDGVADLRDATENPCVADGLRHADSIDATVWFRQQRTLKEMEFEEDAEGKAYYNNILNECAAWPSRPPSKIAQFTSITDLRNSEGKLYPTVCLSLVPTNHPCDTPAWMCFGNWNDCPDRGIHVSLMRYWQERYHIEPVCMTFDILELKCGRPPATPEAARGLALEQYIYCPDIVEQGCQTVDRLAIELWQAPTWFFWWD